MRLTAAFALTLTVYVLVADGLAALFLGGLLGVSGVIVVGAAAAGSWWQEPLRRRFGRVPRLGLVVIALAAGGLGVEIVTLAPTMLDAFTQLLVFLLLVKLYTRRTPRDARDIAFLAFFTLVAVSPATTSVVFLALFVAFLTAGIGLLMLRHLLTEAERAAPAPGPRPLGVGGDFVRLMLAASAATVVITGALFLIIPRVGQAALPLRPQLSRMVSGFSERVELGAFGEIELDATVIMRVHLTEWRGGAGDPQTLPSLRWRGIALDAFDGDAWTVSHSALRLTLRRAPPVAFPVHQYYGGPVLTQEIYLEPIGSEMIFGAARVLRLTTRSDLVTLDDLGNIAVPAPSARLSYTVESEPEVGDPRRANLADARQPPDPRWLARYTQLPPLAPRIAALAREITAGSADHWEAATRLSAWLGRELRYTRVLGRSTSLPPLEEFLFVQRAGNCEYFAAALAVMLRSLGIPARVVNGFQRGEWNPYGGYFMVRLRDAHSWTEVFVDGAGWISLDPSPRAVAEPAAVAARATLWLDALRLSWYRYVVSWSLHDQLAAADTVRRATWTWSAAAVRLPDWRAWPRAAPAALVIATALLLLARRRRVAVGGGAAAVPGFYARALRALARRGLTPGVGETAREFSRRAEAAAAAPLARLTAAYERVRFGGVALTAAEAADVDACLARLEAGAR
jgi:transglutaminase-like putative cysteine protease